jgi:cellulose synthase/poly-beta-1,6-N-acetylglucosamine synthase-like glycosyltransferase
VAVLTLALLLIGILAAWLRFAWILTRAARLPNLARAADAPVAERPWPRVSIVVACRNEEAEVRRAVSSLLAQDYPAYEVVAVDDRSEDATGAILRDVGAQHPGLRVVRVDELPDGWLGKTNALHQGAARASGDWLLFTDADVVFAPHALRRAMAWALGDGLGHAVALPHFIAPGFLERSFVSLFAMFLLLHLRVDQLGRAGSRAHIGLGAFNLVRRDAYLSIGGHERLRMEIADDVKLGLVLRRSGVRQGCADSGGLVRVRWQQGFTASMRGLLKNFFAGSEFSWWQTMRSVLLIPFATTLPVLCLAFAPGAGLRLLGAAAFGVAAVLHGASARRLAGGWGIEGLLLPVAGVCLSLVALVSALGATLRGAVIWRGTRYPLRALRAGSVRDADWPPDRAPGAVI